MHIKKPVSPNKASKIVTMRNTYVTRALRRNSNLLRMLKHIPYFKLQTKINEFTGK